ncbi:hypothetical protein OAS35_00970 [Pelagibacteraceae bacterium]|nr:hypothetical protein [Pelagibacteraceae bacterium]
MINDTNNITLQDKLTAYFNSNKIKISIFASILVLILLFIFFLQINKKNENLLISEKFVEANILLASNNQDKAKKIYDEIILSKNKFYSILALNKVLEENLVNKKEKILEYFNIAEEINKNKDTQDLITFKKALYLKKNLNEKESEELFNSLINSNSNLKSLVEEIISN